MSTCADIRLELVALTRAELDDAARSAVTSHVAGCADCAAELRALERLRDVVHDTLEIEPTPAETESLFRAVDAALSESVASEPVASGPQPSGGRVHALWESALWRYENSTRFRRVTLASLGVHAAAAAVIGWLLVAPGGPRPWRAQVTFEDSARARLERDVPLPLADESLGAKRIDPDQPESLQELPYEPATAEGVQLPDVFESGSMKDTGAKLRFPTRPIMVRLSIALDPAEKTARLERQVEDLAPRANAAVDRGLRYLAARRGDDGSWSPATDTPQDVRTGVTGAVVLAFVTDGRSAREGEFADVLRPAVARLERWLESEQKGSKRVYAHALALRALTWQWALDFRHMTPEERSARRTLLERAGKQLVAWQSEDGGFGYEPRDDRTDASCTVFAAGALTDLRMAGVLRPDAALRKAGRYLDGLRGDDGLVGYRESGDRAGDLALTASMLAHAPELRVRGLDRAVASVARELVSPAHQDALLRWSGLQALHRSGQPLAPALGSVLASQRPDGSWSSATDRHCRQGGDDLTTAFGVLAVTRVYQPTP